MPDTASARPGRAKLWLCAREVGCAPPSPAIILLPLFLERLGVFSSNSLLILTDPPTYPPRSCHAIPSFPFSSLPCVCGVIVSRFRQFALSHPSIHPPLRMHYVTRSKRQLTNLGDMFIACLVISLFFFLRCFAGLGTETYTTTALRSWLPHPQTNSQYDHARQTTQGQ